MVWDWSLVVTLAVGVFIGVGASGVMFWAFWLQRSNRLEPATGRPQSVDPWYKNAFVFCGFALYLVTLILAAEIGLTLAGVEGGLPEAVTTPSFSVASAVSSYAAACLQIRSNTSEPSGG